MFTKKMKHAIKEYIHSSPKYQKMAEEIGRNKTIYLNSGEDEAKFNKTLSNRGHICALTKEGKPLSEEGDKKFKQMLVLWSAMSSALMSEGYGLLDSEAVEKMIMKSQWFAAISAAERLVECEENSIELEKAIIKSVVGVSLSPDSLTAATDGVNDMGSSLRLSKRREKEEEKSAHVMMIVDDTGAVVFPELRLVKTNSVESAEVIDLNCAQKTETTVGAVYTDQVYMFVDPGLINEVVPSFEESEKFDELVEYLKALIREPSAEEVEGKELSRASRK